MLRGILLSPFLLVPTRNETRPGAAEDADIARLALELQRKVAVLARGADDREGSELREVFASANTPDVQWFFVAQGVAIVCDAAVP
jgi:hypothetical protein